MLVLKNLIIISLIFGNIKQLFPLFQFLLEALLIKIFNFIILYSKGSYYANIYSGSLSEYETDKEEFADFISENIWPTNELPDFETSFNDLGKLILNVGILLARQCDIYCVSKIPNYAPNTVENCIRDSVNNKGRLLHYFPLSQENSPSLNCNSDSWCGLHNDHSALTGLTSPMYLENGQIREGEFRDVG